MLVNLQEIGLHNFATHAQFPDTFGLKYIYIYITFSSFSLFHHSGFSFKIYKNADILLIDNKVWETLQIICETVSGKSRNSSESNWQLEENKEVRQIISRERERERTFVITACLVQEMSPILLNALHSTEPFFCQSLTM